MTIPFAARLPADTLDAIKALVESGRFKSQAAVIVAAVTTLASPTPPKAVPLAKEALPLSNVTPTPQKPATAKRTAPVLKPAPTPTPAFSPALHPNDVGSLASRRAATAPFSRDTQRHAS